MNIKLRILRFNPETDRKGHWEEYNLEADPDERILDLLHKVKWFDDGSLAFRRSCACLLYTSPSPRDCKTSRMPSSA